MFFSSILYSWACSLNDVYIYFIHINVSGRSVLLFNKLIWCVHRLIVWISTGTNSMVSCKYWRITGEDQQIIVDALHTGFVGAARHIVERFPCAHHWWKCSSSDSCSSTEHICVRLQTFTCIGSNTLCDRHIQDRQHQASGATEMRIFTDIVDRRQ